MTDIQQTPGDRLRFEILLKSLMEGSLNLAVLSEYDAVLDFYAQLFENSLHAKGETQIEFCSSTSSEQLVQKFNEILSDLTLSQALQKQARLPNRRYLIFRDSILMQEFELQLLARLVNGFPAGNISIILLINSSASARSKLAAFGKNLLQWEVETRGGEPRPAFDQDWAQPPAAALHEPVLDHQVPHEPTLHSSDAASAGADWLDPSDPTPLDDSEVSKLLNMPKKTAWRVPSFGFTKAATEHLKHEQSQAKAPVSPLLDVTPDIIKAAQTSASTAPTPAAVAATSTPVIPAVTAMPAHATSATAKTSAPEESSVVMFDPPARRFPWGMLLLMVVVSASASGYLYRDNLQAQWQTWSKEWLRGTPAPANSAETAASQMHDQASQAIAAAQAQVDVASATQAAQAALVASGASVAASSAASIAASVASSSAPLASDAASSATPAKPSASVAKAPSTPASLVAPIVASAPAAEASAPKTKTKVSATSADSVWLDQVPSTGWVLQLAAFDDENEAKDFKSQQRAFASARILSPYKKGSRKHYYIVVMGPFEDKAQADRFMQKNPLYTRGWLRSGKSVKAQFERPSDDR